jgi:hypothetical protein
MIMPKNVMCKNCNNYRCDWCEKVVDSPDPNMPRTCQYFGERTNADRIRAMSDEELARWVMKFVIDCAIASGIEDPTWDDGSGEAMLEWLQQPAEVE